MGQDNRVDRLQARVEEQQELIALLYKQLDIGYDDNKTLVMEVDQLFRDLPSIINMVCKEQNKMQEVHLKMIKQAL